MFDVACMCFMFVVRLLLVVCCVLTIQLLFAVVCCLVNDMCCLLRIAYSWLLSKGCYCFLVCVACCLLFVDRRCLLLLCVDSVCYLLFDACHRLLFLGFSW